MKKCNHFGFEIACHSLLLCLISKTLVHVLLLMSRDTIVLFYNILKPQIKKKYIDNFFCKEKFFQFFILFKKVFVLRWFINISIALVPQVQSSFHKFSFPEILPRPLNLHHQCPVGTGHSKFGTQVN